MNADNVGEIFVSRQLYYLDQTNQRKPVTVFISKPEPLTDMVAYECRFQVMGIGSQRIQTVRGRDSIQALQSALVLVAASLNHLNDRLGRKLVWEGGIKGELGFP
jgi:hypothetical protein